LDNRYFIYVTFFQPSAKFYKPGRTARELVPLREKIEQFWLDGKNREASTWTEHREINMVMLATSLAPDGFLGI
jgi:hypothetical protein